MSATLVLIIAAPPPAPLARFAEPWSVEPLVATVSAPPVEAPDATELRAHAVPRAMAEADRLTEAAVVASWYGPGMWGNRTACGATLTAEIRGVAHRTLPCGSAVTLRHGATTITVPVVDRGPFVYAREFDLTYATKAALGCPDVCRLVWVR